MSKFVTVKSRKNLTTEQRFAYFLEKEKQDYLFCLNETLKFKPRYSLLIEDDALVHDSFFDILHHVINNKIEKRLLHDDYQILKENITYVKLYHPPRVNVYLGIEIHRIFELIGVSFILGTLLHLSYLQARGSSLNLACASKTLLHFMFILYAILVMCAIGRPYFLNLRTLFPPHLYNLVPASECCTPAMLFPYRGAHTVLSHLTNTTCRKHFGKDMALEGLRKNPRYQAYMVEPNLVTHIGMYSALRNKVLDSFVV